MTADRFEMVAPLPSPRGHLHVAVDRGSRPPRAVVLALYPRAVADDPGRLARLSGEVERAARLFHPNVLAPVGIEAIGGDLAAVTVWRDAVTLREILDAGGRLPSEIAARIAADVCAGLGHAHGRPEPVVHGLLRPEAVLLDESGTAAVSGFGMPGGSGVPDDLLGVGELLHECLLGEPPEDPSRPLESPGVPEPLAALVNRARAADPGVRPPTADALGTAIAEAIPLAPREAVAAYVEAIVPAGSGPREERRRKIEAVLGRASSASPDEISESDIVGVATPLPGDVAAPVPAVTVAPTATAMPPADATPTGPPTSTPMSTSVPILAAMPTSTPMEIPAPIPASTPTSTPMSTSAPILAAMPTSTPMSTSAPIPAPPASTAPASPTRTPTPTSPFPAPALRSGGRRVSLGVAIAMSLGGIVIGFALARFVPWNGTAAEPGQPAPEARAAADARAGGAVAPARSTALPPRPASAPARRTSGTASDKRRAAAVRRLETKAYEKAQGTGFLDVTAPDGAEVWLDGRRIGTGSTRREVPEGNHRVEVRYRGAKVGERFHVAPRETWTYAVTPDSR